MAATYTYWISTALLSLLYLTSAITYVTKGAWVRQILSELGYPAYLVPVMIAVKVLGVAAIVSRFSVALSDLAYAGIFYHLLLSGLAHLGVRTSPEEQCRRRWGSHCSSPLSSHKTRLEKLLRPTCRRQCSDRAKNTNPFSNGD